MYFVFIQDYDPGNMPSIGALVKVKWTDGKMYDGIFGGTNHRLMFTVSDFDILI